MRFGGLVDLTVISLVQTTSRLWEISCGKLPLGVFNLHAAQKVDRFRRLFWSSRVRALGITGCFEKLSKTTYQSSAVFREFRSFYPDGSWSEEEVGGSARTCLGRSRKIGRGTVLTMVGGSLSWLCLRPDHAKGSAPVLGEIESVFFADGPSWV